MIAGAILGFCSCWAFEFSLNLGSRVWFNHRNGVETRFWFVSCPNFFFVSLQWILVYDKDGMYYFEDLRILKSCILLDLLLISFAFWWLMCKWIFLLCLAFAFGSISCLFLGYKHKCRFCVRLCVLFSKVLLLLFCVEIVNLSEDTKLGS